MKHPSPSLASLPTSTYSWQASICHPTARSAPSTPSLSRKLVVLACLFRKLGGTSSELVILCLVSIVERVVKLRVPLLDWLFTKGFLQSHDTEILQALQWWIRGQTVPGTNETISDSKMLDLLSKWIKGTPIS